MTNRDDQEPNTEKPNTGGNELELPELDDDDLESAGTIDSGPETDVHMDVEETELDEFDGDIIDISDEEVQREFEQMDAEEQEASKPSAASNGTETTEEKTAAENLVDLTESVVPKDQGESVLDLNELPPEDSSDDRTATGMVVKYLSKLSPKIAYGSITALAILGAVIIFFRIGSEEPSAAEQAAVGDEQILVAQESTASREIIEQSSPNEPESIFIDTQPEDSEAPARAPELALNVAEELPAAEESEPADEENAGVVDEHSAVIEEIVPAIEPTSSAAEELSIATSTAGPDEIFTLSESTGHFYIIVASFLTEVRAREYAGSLSANEDTPTILSPLGDTSRYRVAIASYETMAEVHANLPSYKSKYGDELWPLRYIVAGTTMMLSAGTGKFYVIVSSFSTEALARKHTDILAATGENPIIIPPFGPSVLYRVALFGYESLTAAQAALPQHRENYGSDAWLLRY